jgi:hypothetical protein
MYGNYVFADLSVPQLFFLPQDGDKFGPMERLTKRVPPLSSFGVDNAGELYMLPWSEIEPVSKRFFN